MATKLLRKRSHEPETQPEPAESTTTVIRKPDRVEQAETHTLTVDRARGGVSAWSVLTGTLVGYGAFFLLAALAGSILVTAGMVDPTVGSEPTRSAAVAIAIAVVIVQFLAYMWGGYTAGRMARGSGAGNGVLVAVMAVFLALLSWGTTALLGSRGLIWTPEAIALVGTAQVRALATSTGLVLLFVTLLGAALGGQLGARWHTRLEDNKLVSRFR